VGCDEGDIDGRPVGNVVGRAGDLIDGCDVGCADGCDDGFRNG
jgi:hypothetical protein